MTAVPAVQPSSRTQTDDPVSKALGELPVPARITPAYARLAVRAIVVHAAETWPQGAVCRNCRASYPCRIHRWGRRVLVRYGLNAPRIDQLAAAGAPDADPS